MKKIDRWLAHDQHLVLNPQNFKESEDIGDFLRETDFKTFEIEISFSHFIRLFPYLPSRTITPYKLKLDDKTIYLEMIHLADRAGYIIRGKAIYE